MTLHGAARAECCEPRRLPASVPGARVDHATVEIGEMLGTAK